MALAEVDRLCRHHDPNPVGWKDHAGTAQARATAAIRATDAPSSRRIVIEPTIISGRLAFLIGGFAGGSTITAANSTASSGAGRTNLPFRATVLQVDRWRLQAIPLGDLIHHRAWPKALGNDLRLDLVRPMTMNLTSRLPGRENLHCSLHGETPVARPWKGDHRLGPLGQRGSGTPVTGLRTRTRVLTVSVSTTTHRRVPNGRTRS